MGLLFLNGDRSSFLKVRITLAMLSLSGNMHVFITWLINRVNDLMLAGSIILKSLEEMPSQPQLFLMEGFLLFSLRFLYLYS